MATLVGMGHVGSVAIFSYLFLGIYNWNCEW